MGHVRAVWKGAWGGGLEARFVVVVMVLVLVLLAEGQW